MYDPKYIENKIKIERDVGESLIWHGVSMIDASIPLS